MTLTQTHNFVFAALDHTELLLHSIGGNAPEVPIIDIRKTNKQINPPQQKKIKRWEFTIVFDVACNSIILLSLDGKKGIVCLFSGDGILLIIIIDTANVRVLEVKVNSTGG